MPETPKPQAPAAGRNPLVPQVCTVSQITQETPDVKTFRLQTPAGERPFAARPGQLGMLSLLGVGEGIFSVSAQGEDWLEMAIKKTGLLTEALHEIAPGQQLGLRGPYGNGFPVEAAQGQNLLFLGGGIGLAPLRSFIRYALARRAAYGNIDILYGARSYADLVFKAELFEHWPQAPQTRVHVTLDQGNPDWPGNVGFLPPYLEECAFSPQNSLALICGPPRMMRACMQSLSKLGFADEQIIITLERRMQCGIGQCGRCNIGGKYVCLEGPVFTKAQLDELPEGF